MHLSLEFFPPKSEAGAQQLSETIRELSGLQPDFVSITCGAGGSAIDGTFALVRHIHETFQLTTVPHLTFLRQRRAYLDDILQAYKKLGVRQVIALRGDPSALQGGEDIPQHEVYVNTIDFVAVLRNVYGMEPIIAAYPDVHPLAVSPQQDFDHLRRKVDAGAKNAITQFFFEPESFLRFRDKVQQASIPVALTPGILPVHNLAQTLKFATSCGAKIPASFADRFERWGDDPAALFKEGVLHATKLCETLQQAGIDDFHFYTMNRSAMVKEVCAALAPARAPASTASN